MSIYIIKPNKIVAGLCIIAANNHNESKIIFNDAFSCATKNPINDWGCTVDIIEELQTTINTSKLIISFIG